jgi:hypothetical protein
VRWFVAECELEEKIIRLPFRTELASPLCHEGRHGGSIGSEGSESQVGMKRGKEHGNRSLTVSYCVGC